MSNLIFQKKLKNRKALKLEGWVTETKKLVEMQIYIKYEYVWREVIYRRFWNIFEAWISITINKYFCLVFDDHFSMHVQCSS